MSKDNVKEMARVLCGRDKDCLFCPIQSPCLMRNCAALLNAEGYRKASEVAREIFEEIENILKSYEAIQCGQKYYYRDVTNLRIAELKKKYTEKGK